MNKINELRTRRSKLWIDAKTYLDEHRGSDGCLSDEDEVVYEKMVSDVVQLGHEIERLESQAHIDREVIRDMEEPMVYEKRGSDMSVKTSLIEANKILRELSAALEEIHSNVIGGTTGEEEKKTPQNLMDEAKFMTGLAYSCLQKVMRIREALL